jgi:DNA polymerase III subunit alpha
MHGRKEVQYHHPALEPILAETYGIIVYQEQIMQIASQLSGYTPGEADLMRRAVGKKKVEALLEHRQKFVSGAQERGIPEDAANRIFDDIEYFARYGFNKAHAADYAVITCQTAYLKAHYPVEYMTALLTVERNNAEKVGILIGECRTMGIPVLPPDINYSHTHFVVEDTESRPAIRFGLGAVKNVGEGAIDVILKERTQAGPFDGLDDFCQRVDLRQVNRRALESLIKVGALQSFGKRAQLLSIIDRMMGLSSQVHQAAAIGQMSMFGQGGFDTPVSGSILFPLPEAEDIPRREILNWEKELVGVYVSEHPMQRAISAIEDKVTCFLGQIDETQVGQKVTVAGIVNSVRQIFTKNGKRMAFVEIEDPQCAMEVIVFPKVYEVSSQLWEEGKVVIVRGKVDNRDGQQLKIICDSVDDSFSVAVPVSSAEEQDYTQGSETGMVTLKDPPGPKFHITISLNPTGDPSQDRDRVRSVFSIVSRFDGEDTFSFRFIRDNRKYRMDFPNSATRHCVELQQQIGELLGATAYHATPVNDNT